MVGMSGRGGLTGREERIKKFPIIIRIVIRLYILLEYTMTMDAQ